MRLIDADALLHNKFITDDIDSYDIIPVDEIVDAPTIDAVEVVRCKDCKAFGKSPWGHFPKGWCKIHGRHRDPDYYCASGVRKDAEVEG